MNERSKFPSGFYQIARSVNPETIAVLFLSFCWLNYSYLYFFSFSQGVSAAPRWVVAIKDLVSFSLIIYFLFRITSEELRKKYYSHLPLIVFSAWIFITSVFHFMQGADVSYFLETKNLLLALPVALLISKRAIERFWLGFHNVLFWIQLIIWIGIFTGFLVLWRDREFSGTIGNPNTLGLLLNGYLLSLLLLSRQSFLSKLFFFSVTALMIIWTRSASQFLVSLSVLAGIFPFAIIRRNRDWIWLPLFCLIAFLLSSQYQAVNHRVILQACSKILSVVDFSPEKIGCPSMDKIEIVSLSISDRASKFREVVTFLKSANLMELAFGRTQGSYFRVDGQYYSLIINHGLTSLFLFIYLILSSVKKCLCSDERWAKFLLGLHFIFGATFLFSRVLHYFPASVFAMSLIALSIGLGSENLKKT